MTIRNTPGGHEASQFQLGFYHLICSGIPEVETKSLTHRLHPQVFAKDVTGEALEFFITANG